MGLNIPDTLDGAVAFGLFAFIVTLVSISLIGLGLAAFPLLNRFGSARVRKIAQRKQAPSSETADIDGAHIAAISAAVATVLGPHRIVRIEPVNHGLSWQAEGRAAQHGSHAISHPGASQRQPENHTGNSYGTQV
jgi:hypothetical protein